MITCVVGRTFLNAFNEANSKSYSPKEFFVNEFWPVFFDHEKYLMSGGNSPFENPKISWKRMIKGSIAFESSTRRLERFDVFMGKAEEVKRKLDASIAMGFPASDEREFASTSGLVSDIEIPTSEDDIYLSWIGSGLGIGISGGFAILFDHPEITLQTYRGWKVYRTFLNNPVLHQMRGNQINSWNGQWLAYSLNPNRFRADFDFSELVNEKVFERNDGVIEVNTVAWAQLFFSMSMQYPGADLLAYVYGFGQTNKTIGFIPFQLKAGTRLKEVYRQLFGGTYTNATDFESLFGIHIKRACELGSIGLMALRPESLAKYMKDGTSFKIKNEEDLITYQAYKTWLIAMLSKNKEEIKDYTLHIAQTILAFRNGGKGMSRITLVDNNLLETKSKKEFLEHLTAIVTEADLLQLDDIKILKDEVHLMTNEEFTYFVTLLKFDYNYLQRKGH